MLKKCLVIIGLMLLPAAAFAQQVSTFVPVTLDVAKINELLDEVPMTVAERSAVVKVINRWELEAQAALRVAPPAPVPPPKVTEPESDKK